MKKTDLANQILTLKEAQKTLNEIGNIKLEVMDGDMMLTTADIFVGLQPIIDALEEKLLG